MYMLVCIWYFLMFNSYFVPILKMLNLTVTLQLQPTTDLGGPKIIWWPPTSLSNNSFHSPICRSYHATDLKAWLSLASLRLDLPGTWPVVVWWGPVSFSPWHMESKRPMHCSLWSPRQVEQLTAIAIQTTILLIS